MNKLIKLILNIFYVFLLIIFSNNFLFSQWKKVEINDTKFQNIYWLDVFFLNSAPKYGWVCGFGGNIMRTTDGGYTWQGTTIESMVIDSVFQDSVFVGLDTNYVPIVNQLESIQFLDSLIGYTSGEDKAFKSTDGGKSWEIISKQGMSIWGLYFVNNDVGMLIGGGCDNFQEFYRTVDGGKNWSNFEANEAFTGLSDLILYSTTGLGYASSSGLIWKTTNGGKTWYPFSVSGDRDWQEELTNIGKSFLVPYSQGCFGGYKEGGLRMSIDNGRNWREYRTGVSMFGAFLLDSLRGWGCGNNNSIYYTNDGGKTWELKNCGIEPATSLDDLWFINDTLGFVVGRGIYRTYFYDTTYSKIANDKPNVICQGDSLMLSASDNYSYHKWSTGDTTNSIYVKQPGWYYLSSYNNPCDFVFEDSAYVDFAPIPDLQIISNKSFDFCEGDSVLLWVNIPHKKIYWSTGETTDTIMVSKSGEFKVNIIDINGCEYSKSETLIAHPLPNVKIEGTGRATFCIGDSIILRTKREYSSYYWFDISYPDSMLSDERFYVAQSSGSYSVKVKDKWGCESIADYFEITVLILNNSLSLRYNASKNVVDFDTVNLTESRCLPIKILNVTNKNFILDDVFLKHNIEFSLPQSQFPLLISRGDSVILSICYRPLELRLDRDTIVIDDTCRPHIIPLKGYGGKNIYITKSKNKKCDADIKFETLGLVSDEYFNKVNIYPNPSSGELRIDIESILSSKPKIEVILFDALGMQKSQGMLSSVIHTQFKGKLLLNFSIILDNFELNSGLYFIRISIDGHFRIFKVSIIK